MHNKKQSTGKEDSASFINRMKIHTHKCELNSFCMLTFLNKCSQLHSLFKRENESKVKMCNLIPFRIIYISPEKSCCQMSFDNAHLYIGVLYHNFTFIWVTLNIGIHLNPADSNFQYAIWNTAVNASQAFQTTFSIWNTAVTASQVFQNTYNNPQEDGKSWLTMSYFTYIGLYSKAYVDISMFTNTKKSSYLPYYNLILF